MIFRVFSFKPETVQQEGFSLVAEFDFEADAIEYAQEKHTQTGAFFRVEKQTSSFDQIIFEHKVEPIVEIEPVIEPKIEE